MFKKLLLILFVIFGLNLLLSCNSFAVSDVTYTIDQDTPNNTDFCNSSCSTYKYIYIHDISLPSSDLYITLHLVGQFDNSNVLKFGINSRIVPSFLLYNVDLSSLSSNALVVEKTSFPGNVSWSFKVTLSENNPTSESCSEPSGTLNITENGTFDVTNYAVAVVDVPTETIVENIEDPISNDFQKVFFAIVEKIIPAFGIFLVVWFGIDMLSSLIFGRGR